MAATDTSVNSLYQAIWEGKDGLQATLISFFLGLQWLYIIILSTAFYGFQHTRSLDWFIHLVNKRWWRANIKWFAGIIILLLFMLFRGVTHHNAIKALAADKDDSAKYWKANAEVNQQKYKLVADSTNAANQKTGRIDTLHRMRKDSLVIVNDSSIHSYDSTLTAIHNKLFHTKATFKKNNDKVNAAIASAKLHRLIISGTYVDADYLSSILRSFFFAVIFSSIFVNIPVYVIKAFGKFIDTKTSFKDDREKPKEEKK